MRIAVLGGCGFVGSHVVDLLVERGHEVIVRDDLSSCWLGPLDLESEGGLQEPRFKNAGATYLPPHEPLAADDLEVVVDAALRHPVERELTMFRLGLERIHCAAWLASEGARLRTLRRYVVVSSNEIAAARPGLLGRHLRAFSEVMLYLHRPPIFDVEFVHLPELYGPRQLPGGGDVAAAILGVPFCDVEPAFGNLGFVLDAAAYVVERALAVHQHRTTLDYCVSAPMVDAEVLYKILRSMGREEESKRALDVSRPRDCYAGPHIDVALVETSLADGIERTIEFYDWVSAEEEAGR